MPIVNNAVAAPLAPLPAGFDQSSWDAACEAVRNYCGWHIAPVVNQTLTLDGSGATVQMLPTLRLSSVDEVLEDGVTQTVTYANYSQHGYLFRSDPWTCNRNGLIVTITHGYDACPPAILSLLREAAQRGDGSAMSQVGQVRMGGVAGVPGAAAFIAANTGVLDRYKLPPRP